VNDKTRVIVIGIDGASWDLLEPWINEGVLPTLEKLVKRGIYGRLESTIPPWTIPAWESMTTGKNPKKLGFATFMVKKGYKFVPYIFMKHNQQKMFWELLSDTGYRVILANLPNVYSAKKINGCIISGWLCIDRDKLAYPPELIEDVNKYCGDYKIDILDIDFERGIVIENLQDKNYIKNCEELLEKHFCLFKYLLCKYMWDFGFMVFVTPDRIQHKYWDLKLLLDHYRKIDAKLKELLEMMGDDTILFLMSDHGFGPIKYNLNINEFFIREGFLKLKKNNKRTASMLLLLVEKMSLLSLASSIVNLLPSIIAKRLKEYVSSISFERMDIDWSATKAFAYAVLGDIYINVKGREPSGVVEPGEYNKIREEIIEKLKNISYKGKRLNIQIFKKEEIYPNATLWDNLPDLIIVPTEDGIQSINPNIGTGQVIGESNGTKGNHRLNGILLAYGPGIKKGQRVDARIYDIAPTILHIFDLPIPNDMDGRVLTEIFEEDSEFAKRKPKYVDPSYYDKKQEDEKLKQAIKNLKLKGKI